MNEIINIIITSGVALGVILLLIKVVLTQKY